MKLHLLFFSIFFRICISKREKIGYILINDEVDWSRDYHRNIQYLTGHIFLLESIKQGFVWRLLIEAKRKYLDDDLSHVSGRHLDEFIDMFRAFSDSLGQKLEYIIFLEFLR